MALKASIPEPARAVGGYASFEHQMAVSYQLIRFSRFQNNLAFTMEGDRTRFRSSKEGLVWITVSGSFTKFLYPRATISVFQRDEGEYLPEVFSREVDRVPDPTFSLRFLVRAKVNTTFEFRAIECSTEEKCTMTIEGVKVSLDYPV